jgi:hypothetical protein
VIRRRVASTWDARRCMRYGLDPDFGERFCASNLDTISVCD